MKNEPIVIERSFQAPVARVWKAITDRDQMKEWYFDISSFKAEPGFEFQFEGTNEGRTYLHKCRVMEVIPEKKLKYSWRYEGYEGSSVVTFELFTEGAITRLRLTHEGLETFPANLPDFARQNFVEGWTFLIGESLKSFLDKAPAGIA